LKLYLFSYLLAENRTNRTIIFKVMGKLKRLFRVSGSLGIFKIIW